MRFSHRRRNLLAAGTGISILGVSGFYAYKIAEKDRFLFAAIGDYGIQKPTSDQVAELVKSWEPDFIITLGDNNYRRNPSIRIDDNVGRLYSDYIYPYHGAYGEGSPTKTNRFWPCLGDHDWDAGNIDDYLAYFSLPGNGRYYELRIGPLHLLAQSSQLEPDGKRENSVQGKWFQDRLLNSDAVWKIVYGHKPPYASGFRGGYAKLRWPYDNWGVTAVLGGDYHNYERLEEDGVPYFVNGLGGNDIYEFGKVRPESKFRYNAKHGAMKIYGDDEKITFEFWNVDGEIIDSISITR